MDVKQVSKVLEPQDLNILALKEKYIEKSQITDEKGRKLVNSNPKLLKHDIEKYSQLFEARKATYLEQETKERFLRGILSDPPLFVEQADLHETEKRTKEKKERLKQIKREAQETIEKVQQQGRLACESAEKLDELTDQLEASEHEIAEMTRELQMLEELIKQEEASKSLETSDEDGDIDQMVMDPNDEELVVDNDTMKRINAEYSAQLQEINATIDQVTKHLLPDKRQQLLNNSKELQSLKEYDQLLDREIAKLKDARQKHSIQRKQMLVEQEQQLQYYESMVEIVIKILGFEDCTVQKDVQIDKHCITFRSGEKDFVVTFERDGELHKFQVIDTFTQKPIYKEEEISRRLEDIKRSGLVTKHCQVGLLIFQLR